MAKTFTKELLKAALIRALHTFLQGIVGGVTVGYAIEEVEWIHILSVSAVAAFVSFCKGIIAGLPEAADDGTLLIDTSDPEVDRYRLQYNSDLTDISTKKRVVFVVSPGADLREATDDESEE